MLDQLVVYLNLRTIYEKHKLILKRTSLRQVFMRSEMILFISTGKEIIMEMRWRLRPPFSKNEPYVLTTAFK